ncbi:selenocysteine insertion sequence-binding protein 2 isoform X2 [Ascaphus truei]|uniref:selenocysteine insertion sequence-binding protein 2 isoform X2 n=1 Tax=Ascaphus truei TaxID=8439 RepID=UPI003F59C883
MYIDERLKTTAAAAAIPIMQPGVSPESTTKPASWASKVSQAHKNVMFSTSSTMPPSSSQEHRSQAPKKMQLAPNVTTEAEMEEVAAKKRKKKKKKNKPSPNSDHRDAEKCQNKNIIVQEPPKFQDDEEFPDLASSVGSSERGPRLGTIKSYSYSQVSRHAVEAAKTKGGGRKSKAPVQLDLGGMLAALEQKQHTEKTKQSTKPVVLSVGGGVPMLTREPVTVTKHQQSKQEKAPHNPLDSSAPLVKKGKQREVPKAKKPTSLKKIILKEREQRKQQQSSVAQEAIPPSEDIVPDEAEVSAEIQEMSEDDPSFTHDMDGYKEETGESPPDISEVVDDELSEDHPEATELLIPASQLSFSLPKIHSRRFREYCSQVLSKEVDSCVTELLKELVRFQDRLHQKDPVKAKTKRRLVMGLREVLKHLKLRKLKCIIISPNCEKIQSKGGLDDTLQMIISCACEQNVPFVFALNRKALGRCVNKAVPVSVVGIFSYDGAQGGSFCGVEPEGLLWSLQPWTPFRRLLRRDVQTSRPAACWSRPPRRGASCGRTIFTN